MCVAWYFLLLLSRLPGFLYLLLCDLFVIRSSLIWWLLEFVEFLESDIWVWFVLKFDFDRQIRNRPEMYSVNVTNSLENSYKCRCSRLSLEPWRCIQLGVCVIICLISSMLLQSTLHNILYKKLINWFIIESKYIHILHINIHPCASLSRCVSYLFLSCLVTYKRIFVKYVRYKFTKSSPSLTSSVFNYIFLYHC